MSFVSDAMLHTVANEMPSNVFDSHAVIDAVRLKAPGEYAREVAARAHLRDPIRATHAAFGKALVRLPNLRRRGKTYSRNVRGKVTSNEGWRRV